MVRRRVLATCLLAVACSALDARAQSEAAIGLGLTVTSNDPTGGLGTGATGIGPLLRVKMGTGFGPTIGFDWYKVGVRAVAGGRPMYIGRLSVKPVMAGVAYNWNRRKFWLSASVVGGYAFTGLKVNDQARPAFRAELGASYLSFDVSNSLVWRPQLGVWYDVAPRVGLTTSIAYIGVRPTLRVTGDNGMLKTPLHGSCSVLTFGVVYGVF